MCVWKYSESPLVDGDKVIATPGGKDAMLAAFDKKSGPLLWKCAIPNLGDKGADGAAYSSAVVADIAVDRGNAVADKLGSAGHFVKLDVTSEDNWKAAIAETVDKFGAIHVLLNSAGIGLSKTVEDITLEEWRRVHAIDLDGVFLGCKHGVAEIKKHTHKLGGSVINISSISGIIAGANMAAYNSAKAGVRLLSKSVALHCAKSGYNIRCNSVHPTFIDTPILDRYRDRFGNEVMQQKLGRQVPIGRLGRPEEVGWALVFLASDESSFMTGSEVVIDGGISAM